MRIYTKGLLVGLAATMLMAFAIGSASARNLSISNQQIRSAFRSLEFSVEGLPTDRCDVTLEGSLHSRTIAKVVNSLLGYITRVTTANCTLTTAILNLPWHVRYRAFSGTLPNITLLTVRVSRASFSSSFLGVGCLGEPEIDGNFRREAGGRLTGVDVVTNTGFDVRGPACEAEEVTGTFRGPNVGTVTLLGNSNDISVTLI